jgi:hypothetical protein
VKGGFATPSGGTAATTPDVLGPTQSLVKGLAKSLRVHSAQREVQRTLAEYCAAQPNGGAAIQVCSTLPAIR